MYYDYFLILVYLVIGISHEIDFEKGLKNLIMYYSNSDIDLNEMLEEDIIKNWEAE